MKTWLIWITSLLFTLGVFHGLAFAGEEDRLRDAAAQYWDARAKCDWQKLYNSLSPAEKKKKTAEQFASLMTERNAFTFVSSKIVDSKVDGNLGWVEMENVLQSKDYEDMPPTKAHFWQVWRKTEDSWHAMQKEDNMDAPRLPPHLRNTAEEERLSKRIAETWEAKEKGDWPKVYEALSPNFHQKMPVDQFMKMTALNQYLGHQTEWVEAIGNQGRAKTTCLIKSNDPSLAKMDSAQTTMIENWILIDGQWYMDTKN